MKLIWWDRFWQKVNRLTLIERSHETVKSIKYSNFSMAGAVIRMHWWWWWYIIMEHEHIIYFQHFCSSEYFKSFIFVMEWFGRWLVLCVKYCLFQPLIQPRITHQGNLLMEYLRQFVDGISILTCYHINFTHGLFLYRAVLLWKLYNKDVGIMTGVLRVHYFMWPRFSTIVHHQHRISSSPKHAQFSSKNVIFAKTLTNKGCIV